MLPINKKEELYQPIIYGEFVCIPDAGNLCTHINQVIREVEKPDEALQLAHSVSMPESPFPWLFQENDDPSVNRAQR